MSTMTPCLWFDGKAEEAANFYASLFPDSHVDAVHRAPSDYPSGKAGDVLMVEFTLMGRPFTGLNGGPQFRFNEAISFQIPVETQAEVDRLTGALSAVPEAEQCGWVKDRFGVSWQIVPRQLIKLIGDADAARARRAFAAIVLHIGGDCQTLLPADPAARARAMAWLIAALNSVEPYLMQLATIDVFAAGEEWARLRRPGVIEMIHKRLSRLSDALGDRPYLDGDRFTAGDLMMTTVLRITDGKGLLDRYSNLVAYKARCQARPAFQAALAAQIADFEKREPV